MHRISWMAWARRCAVGCAVALVACGPGNPVTPTDAGDSAPTDAARGDAGPIDVDGGPVVEIPPAGSSVTQPIGPEGGSLAIGSFLLEVPESALVDETEITVTVTADVVPGAFTGFSPIFRFEPAGLVFERPVTVTLPFSGDSDIASVFWTASSGAGYVALPTRVEAGHAVVEATHFSRAFVGTACTGSDCCGRANGDLDVLLMVDNSGSMAEEQASLAAQIPRMARVLGTGDLDGDGVQDFPALRSVRIGTVTSDMGTGGFAVTSCNTAFGDDGILRTQGNTAAACDAAYPSFAEMSADDPSLDVDAFVDQVSCVATVGIGGCGFEQQLESVLKALTPATSSIRFQDGTAGHGDGANAGFLRPDSVLATIVMTDENDCSASDPSLFDPESAVYTENLNLRCFQHPAALHPVSRYVDGLRALRSDPSDVIFGLIAGVPTDLITDGSGTDYAGILSDPRMMESVDPTTGNQLVPSCEEAGGMAFPPRRLVEAAQGFGGNGVVQSICQEDFTGAVDAILQRVAARVSGSCG